MKTVTPCRVCIAEAEEITIKKGLIKGTSLGALSKLAVDVYQKYEHALGLLKSVDIVVEDLIIADRWSSCGANSTSICELRCHKCKDVEGYQL